MQLTQTLKFKLRYVTDSTLNPMVGIVVTTSPICPNKQTYTVNVCNSPKKGPSTDNIPLTDREELSFQHYPIHPDKSISSEIHASSLPNIEHTRPRMRIRISFLDQSRFHMRDREAPIFVCVCRGRRKRGERERSRREQANKRGVEALRSNLGRKQVDCQEKGSAVVHD